MSEKLNPSILRVVKNFVQTNAETFEIVNEMLNMPNTSENRQKYGDDPYALQAAVHSDIYLPTASRDFSKLYDLLIVRGKRGLLSKIEEIQELIKCSNGLRMIANIAQRKEVLDSLNAYAARTRENIRIFTEEKLKATIIALDKLTANLEKAVSRALAKMGPEQYAGFEIAR